MRTRFPFHAAILAMALAPSQLPGLDISSTWTGTVSRDWDNTLNWSPTQVPDNQAPGPPPNSPSGE